MDVTPYTKAGVCGKQRHRDRLDALMLVARIRYRDDPRRDKLPRRVYYCQPCKAWHLTSKEAR